MRDWWTIGRASGLGATAGLLALALWPLQRAYGESFALPQFVAAVVAGLCGISILAITAFDLLFHRRRGARLRPVRMFDIILGAALVLLSLLQLDDLVGQFGTSW